jgi:S1-C subfamily serine protease
VAEEGTEPAPAARWKQVLPRTTLGLAGLVFCMGVAAAFTGAVLYAYYDARLAKTNKAVEAFRNDFSGQVDAARAVIKAEGDSAQQAIKDQLKELQKFAASGATLSSMLDKTKDSVWFVSTLDEAGQASVGSAFVVFADADTSYLLTSYTTVRAATVAPGPDVTLHKGDENLAAKLVTWDPARDMALLSIAKGNVPALAWSTASPPATIGDRVFVVSGLGTAGGAITQGLVAISADGIQHDAPVGAAFQGGPVLNTEGQVIAMASRTYGPLGFDPLAVFFAPPVTTACQKVLQCPAGGQPTN